MSIEQNAKISGNTNEYRVALGAPVASFAAPGTRIFTPSSPAQLVAGANFSVTQSLRVESKTNKPPGSEGEDSWGKIMSEGASFHRGLAKPPEHRTSLPHQDLEK
jgi:hypothetical protein